jgi:CRP-like cAMP-binding protein
MKSFPWKPLLQKHPIFSTIHDEQKIESLLVDGVSEERVYLKDEEIVRQDEIGDSLFVIGDGSAEALLEVGEGPPIHLSTMRKGEVFGEMAFFEERPRAATVRAKEPCTVLEIQGAEFQSLVDEYPDIEFKLLLKMSERLRHTNERILTLHLTTVDEKLKLFNDRLDTEHKVFEASLKGAQTMFDQTKLRADEVINSAERSRDRLNKSAAVVGTFVTILVGLAGLFGWSKVSELDKLQTRTTQAVTTVESSVKTVESSARNVGNLAKEVEKSRNEAQVSAAGMEAIRKKAEESIQAVKDLFGSLENLKADLKKSQIEIYRRRFYDALDKGSASEAPKDYLLFKEAGGLDEEQFVTLLWWLDHYVVAKAQNPGSDQERSKVKDYLWLFQDAVIDAPTPRKKLDAYYLLLTYAYLTDQSDFPKRDGEYRRLATRREALAALKEDVKRAPKETPEGHASKELRQRVSQEAGKPLEEDLRDLSRVALVSVERP